MDSLHTKSTSKKKKKKKHSKHKRHKHGREKTSCSGDRGSSPLFKIENQSISEVKHKERKRKLSQSSGASSVTSDSVKSFKMPKLELEVSESDVTKIKIRNIQGDLRVSSKIVGNENNNNSFNVNENLISRSHSYETLDSIKTSSSSSLISLGNQEKSLSGNKTLQIVNNSNKSSLSSEHSAEIKTVKSRVEPNIVGNSSSAVSEPSRVSNSNLWNSATKRREHANSEVEQADSGIASPASEDGADGSRKGFSNPLDDILRKTDLPVLSGGEKVPGLGTFTSMVSRSIFMEIAL